MRRSDLRITALLIAMLALPGGVALAQATGQVTGTVTSTEGSPLPGVAVTVNGQGGVTNAQGRYTIPAVSAGSRMVTANVLGYSEQSRPVTITAGRMRGRCRHPRCSFWRRDSCTARAGTVCWG